MISVYDVADQSVALVTAICSNCMSWQLSVMCMSPEVKKWQRGGFCSTVTMIPHITGRKSQWLLESPAVFRLLTKGEMFSKLWLKWCWYLQQNVCSAPRTKIKLPQVVLCLRHRRKIKRELHLPQSVWCVEEGLSSGRNLFGQLFSFFRNRVL